MNTSGLYHGESYQKLPSRLITEQYEICGRSQSGPEPPRSAQFCSADQKFLGYLSFALGCSRYHGERTKWLWQFPSEDSQFLWKTDRLQMLIIQRRWVNAVVSVAVVFVIVAVLISVACFTSWPWPWHRVWVQNLSVSCRRIFGCNAELVGLWCEMEPWPVYGWKLLGKLVHKLLFLHLESGWGVSYLWGISEGWPS